MRNAILQELHAEYEQQRYLNEQENRRRQAEATEKCPELAQVLQDRQNMIFGTLRGILAGHAPADADCLPQRMEVLNRRVVSLLTQNGFSADYLDPVFRCKTCEDTGYIGDPIREQCVCFRTAFYSRLYQQMGLGEQRKQSFEQFDLNVFSAENLPGKAYSQRTLMSRICHECRAYTEKYPDLPVRNLLLMGKSGLGKTYLMHAMAKALLQRGFNVMMLSAYEFLKIARKVYMTGQNAEMDDLIDCDVLLIDDMGAEPMMENVTIVQWFNLINERQLRRKGTVISTNLMEDELRERYTERIASRLMNRTDCTLLQFLGEDVRRTGPC